MRGKEQNKEDQEMKKKEEPDTAYEVKTHKSDRWKKQQKKRRGKGKRRKKRRRTRRSRRKRRRK